MGFQIEIFNHLRKLNDARRINMAFRSKKELVGFEYLCDEDDLSVDDRAKIVEQLFGPVAMTHYVANRCKVIQVDFRSRTSR